MTIHIPHDVVVVLITLAAVVVLPTLYGLFQLGHMDASYRDQISWWFEDRKRKREAKKNENE